LPKNEKKNDLKDECGWLFGCKGLICPSSFFLFLPWLNCRDALVALTLNLHSFVWLISNVAKIKQQSSFF